MFWFLRRLRFSHAAALFGAMLFAFSGFNLLHHHHINMVAVVAHMPWLLACGRRADRGRAQARANARVRGHRGDPRVGVPAGIPAGRLVERDDARGIRSVPRRPDRALAATGCRALAAVALGVLLGGIQLLPTADCRGALDAGGAVRRVRADLLAAPVQPVPGVVAVFLRTRRLQRRATVMWFHEFGIYSGAILPVALIWVWIRRDALPERRALIAAVTVFAALEPGPRARALRRRRGVCSRICRSSSRSARPFATSSSCSSRSRSWRPSRSTICWRSPSGRSAPPPGRRMAALWIPAALGVATTLALNSGLLPYGREHVRERACRVGWASRS